MTTAHRPTFDPARGNANKQASGSILHSRMLPAHQRLKFRQRGQGGDADKDTGKVKSNDELKRKLLEEEQDHMHKIGLADDQLNNRKEGEEEESREEKRRRILEENKEIDADDSNDSEDDDDSDEDDDEESDEDETALLMKELQKIKQERAEEKAAEEAKQQLEQQEEREKEIAFSNPLLNPSEFTVKKSWTEDTIFKHQALNTDTKQGFINDTLRSDFHKKFMDRYIK